MRVGWLGLGAMGAPMAACLVAAGHSVSAYDVVPDRAPRGAWAAASVPAAVTGADAIVVMVATPEQLDQVLSSAAPSLAPGQTVAIMSTVGPEAVVAAAARLEAAGVAVVDAPARSAPVVGPSPGDGQRMKLVSQLLCGIHIAAAAEALSFAETLGLNPGECREVLRGGAAASFMFDDRGERMVSGQFDDVRSALDIFVKDMGLVTSAAGNSGARVPLSTAARQLYQRGHDQGLGRKDDSALIEVLRDRR